jgi:hypothetical protein
LLLNSELSMPPVSDQPIRDVPKRALNRLFVGQTHLLALCLRVPPNRRQQQYRSKPKPSVSRFEVVLIVMFMTILDLKGLLIYAEVAKR